MTRSLVLAFSVATLMVIGCVAGESATQAELDNYCINISKMVDKQEALNKQLEATLPKLPARDRPKASEYMKAIRENQKLVRKGACEAKDLKSAKLATKRDSGKGVELTKQMIAYMNHSLAETYREKAKE